MHILRLALFFVVWLFQTLLLASTLTHQSSDTSVFCSHKRVLFLSGSAFAYTSSMTGLYSLWYKDYPKSSFHFFNDNTEWLGMDKMGHFASSYQTGRYSYALMQWSCFSDRKSLYLGGFSGLLFLTSIEIFDGFSKQWGFSPGDMFSNVGGAGLFVLQQKYWGEQRIQVKYSYFDRGYAQYRPDLFGKNAVEKLVKDYNGITIWASGNIHCWLPRDSRFPKWINIAMGYGAEGMLGGKSNPVNYKGNPLPQYPRERRFILSPDIDISQIPVQKPFLKKVLFALSFLKVPMPAIEFKNNKKAFFRPIYF